MTARVSPTATLDPRPTAAAGAGADALMTAAVRTTYGGPEVLRLAEVARPRPGAGEVLIRARASSVNFGDNVMLTGRPWLARLVIGLRRPRNPVFGLDVAGEVVEVGEGVTAFAVGDRVFGEAEGAHARYVVASATKVARIPDGVGMDQAGAAPVAGVTAERSMRLAGVKPGDRVLVNGASGGVGTFAVQVARALGAEVTAVCSGRNRELVTRLGATHVVDYTAADFSATDVRYDVILDLVGSKPLRTCLSLLAPGGRYLPSVGSFAWTIKSALRSLVDRRIKVLHAAVETAHLERLGALMASGAVQAEIERTFDLGDVAEAMAHQRTRRTRGKSAIRIG